MADRTMLDAALQLADAGFGVFPLHTPVDNGCSCGRPDCQQIGKHPRTRNGFKDATTDQDRIREWWGDMPDANIAIATGRGIVVLDEDPRHNGNESLHELEAAHGELQTLTCRTGGGGLHFYFAAEARSRTGFLPGLDLKGEGGYVVAPPSLHASGRRYEWSSAIGPQPIPGWLAAVIAHQGTNGNGAAPSPIGESIPEGQRDNTLTSLAGTMAKRNMSEAAVLAALREENATKCTPPLPDADVQRIARGIARRELAANNPGTVEHGRMVAEAIMSTNGMHPHAASSLEKPLSFGELLTVQDPVVRDIADGLIPGDANILIAAYPKSHKTNLLLELGVAAASATPFLGRFAVSRTHRVGLVLMEDVRHRVRRRLERMCAAHGVPPQELADQLHIWFRPAIQFANARCMAELKAHAVDLGLDLLGVDNWSYVASGNSNDSDDVTPQLRAFSSIREACPGMSVLLVQHARKEGQDRGGERLTDIIRNSSAFGAWYDAGFVLSRQDEHSPVMVRSELRDRPAPAAFSFTVEDEHPGDDLNAPSGYLRLAASQMPPAFVQRQSNAERLLPVVREFLSLHSGASKSELKRAIPGDDKAVDAAFEMMRMRGEARYEEPEKRGMAGRCFLVEQ